jgi:hypothetical protein
MARQVQQKRRYEVGCYDVESSFYRLDATNKALYVIVRFAGRSAKSIELKITPCAEDCRRIGVKGNSEATAKGLCSDGQDAGSGAHIKKRSRMDLLAKKVDCSLEKFQRHDRGGMIPRTERGSRIYYQLDPIRPSEATLPIRDQSQSPPYIHGTDFAHPPFFVAAVSNLQQRFYLSAA